MRGSLVIEEADATHERVLAAMETARWVHLAAHGDGMAQAPAFQALLVTGQPLYAYQVYERDLRGVEVVTLSACQSALGRFDVIDNLRGLAAALFAAGAGAGGHISHGKQRMSPLVLDPPPQFDVDIDGTGSGPLLGGAPPGQPLDAPPVTPALVERPTISLGVIAHEVAPDALDDQAVAYEMCAQANTYRFSMLGIRATIRPRENATVELLNLGCTLEQNEFALEPPVAWSLSPQRLVTTRKSPYKSTGPSRSTSSPA